LAKMRGGGGSKNKGLKEGGKGNKGAVTGEVTVNGEIFRIQIRSTEGEKKKVPSGGPKKGVQPSEGRKGGKIGRLRP